MEVTARCSSYVIRMSQKKKTLAHHSLMWLSGKGIRPKNSEFLFRARGPFLESPGNFSGPKSDIQIEI